MGPETEDLDLEFDVVLRRAGFAVPDAWRGGALAAYREMREMAARMRQPRSAESAPSNIFVPQVLVRTR